MPVPWQETEILVVLLPSVGARARVPASCVRAAWCRRRVEAEQYLARLCLKSWAFRGGSIYIHKQLRVGFHSGLGFA